MLSVTGESFYLPKLLKLLKIDGEKEMVWHEVGVPRCACVAQNLGPGGPT